MLALVDDLFGLLLLTQSDSLERPFSNYAE